LDTTTTTFFQPRKLWLEV
jgi:hypothetical protein